MFSTFRQIVGIPVICAVLSLFVACKGTDTSLVTGPPVFTDSVYLESTVFTPEAVVITPSQMDIVEDVLLFYRPGGAAVKTFSAETGEELPQITISLGRGPGEFMEPWIAGYSREDSIFFIFDRDVSFSSFKWDRSGDGEMRFNFVSKENVTRPEGKVISRGLVLNDRQALFHTSFRSDSLLLIMDRQTGDFTSFCTPPIQANSKDLSHFSGYTACYEDLMFFVSQSIGYIVCYSFDRDNNVRKEWEYLMAQPVILPQEEFKLDRERNPNGFYDLKVTDDYVFVAYSGNTMKIDDPSSHTQIPETLLVFDHSGNPVKKIKLDKKVGRFALTPDNSAIYSFYIPTSRIIKYDLSAVLP